MTLYWIVMVLVTVAMAITVVTGWRRSHLIDAGGRWLIRGVTISLAMVPLFMILRNRPAYWLLQFQILLETTCMVFALAEWQHAEGQRRAIRWLTVPFVVTWLVAQGFQDSVWSVITSPVAGLLKVLLAGVTLIQGVKATDDRWTDYVWFWGSCALIVIYGTEVVLDPLWSVIYSEDDPGLSIAAYIVHNAAGVIGYLAMTRALYARPAAHQWPVDHGRAPRVSTDRIGGD